MSVEGCENFLLDELRRVRERLEDPNHQLRRERDTYHEEVLVRLRGALFQAASGAGLQAVFEELDRLIGELARALPSPVSLPTRAQIRRRSGKPLSPAVPTLPPTRGAWADPEQAYQLSFDDVPEPAGSQEPPPDEPEAVRLLRRYLETPGREPQAAARARILLRLRDELGRL